MTGAVILYPHYPLHEVMWCLVATNRSALNFPKHWRMLKNHRFHSFPIHPSFFVYFSGCFPSLITLQHFPLEKKHQRQKMTETVEKCLKHNATSLLSGWCFFNFFGLFLTFTSEECQMKNLLSMSEHVPAVFCNCCYFSSITSDYLYLTVNCSYL